MYLYKYVLSSPEWKGVAINGEGRVGKSLKVSKHEVAISRGGGGCCVLSVLSCGNLFHSLLT